MVCGTLGRWTRIEPPLYPRRLGFFHFDRAFSTEKAQRELGYDPQIGIETGLARTIQAWRNEGLLRQPEGGADPAAAALAAAGARRR